MKNLLNKMLKYWPILTGIAITLVSVFVTAVRLAGEIQSNAAVGVANDKRLDMLEKRIVELETTNKNREHWELIDALKSKRGE